MFNANHLFRKVTTDKNYHKDKASVTNVHKGHTLQVLLNILRLVCFFQRKILLCRPTFNF